MTNAKSIQVLHVASAIGMTLGGASTIPGLSLPPHVLAYGLLIAAICQAIAGNLVQVKGESDEAQGITPAQLTAVQAVHDAAKGNTGNLTSASSFAPPVAAGNYPAVTGSPGGSPGGTGGSPVPPIAIAAGVIVLAFGLCWLVTSCASVPPGSDPLVVRTEAAETVAFATFDTFLKLDDLAMAAPAVSNAWAGAAHPFAGYLRKPIVSGTNTVPFGIATILSVDQIKLAYQAGTSTSNALVTALDALSATVAQASQYTSLMTTNK
jgi:hypothetical protein